MPERAACTHHIIDPLDLMDAVIVLRECVVMTVINVAPHPQASCLPREPRLAVAEEQLETGSAGLSHAGRTFRELLFFLHHDPESRVSGAPLWYACTRVVCQPELTMTVLMRA